MLVLTRKINEEILVGSTIRVVVLKVNGGSVKLGLSAPREVAIYRKEMHNREPQAARPPAEDRRQGRRQSEDVEAVPETSVLTAPLITTTVSQKEH